MTGFVGLKRCKRDHRQDGLAGVTGFRCVADVLPIAQMSTAGNVATKTRRREGALRIRVIEGGRLGLPAPFLTPSCTQRRTSSGTGSEHLRAPHLFPEGVPKLFGSQREAGCNESTRKGRESCSQQRHFHFSTALCTPLQLSNPASAITPSDIPTSPFPPNP